MKESTPGTSVSSWTGVWVYGDDRGGSMRQATASLLGLASGLARKHLRAFRVTIDPRRAHKMIEYKHEGEEFVYVLRGEVEIKVGEDLHILKPGESIHFEASIPHHLRNPSGRRTEMIVVLHTP